MKQKYWKLRKIFGQIIILFMIGFALFWIGQQLNKLDLFIEAKWIKFLFVLCIILFVSLCISTISSLILDNVTRPYNPADQQSLDRLKSQKKYQLNSHLLDQLRDKGNFVKYIAEWLEEEGYQAISKHKIGIIYEKKTPFYTLKREPKYHRMFLLYRPLLNVLIVDNILSEAVDLMDADSSKQISQNNLILVTDMKNEEEVLSAGAGIVNYVSTKQTSYLYPLFIDLSHAHLFYPQDSSLVPWYKRIAKKFELWKFKSWLKIIVNQ